MINALNEGIMFEGKINFTLTSKEDIANIVAEIEID